MRLFYISLVLLFSLCFYFIILNTTSYAYTIDDFIEFTSQVRDLNSNFNTCTNQILTNAQSLKRDLSSYSPTTFIVTNANWTASFNTTILRFRSTPIKIDIYTNSISIQSAYKNRSQWYEALFLNGVWQVSNASSDIQSCANTSTFGLIDLDNQSFDNWYNNYFNGKYSIKWVMGIEHPNNPNDPLPLLIGQALTSFNYDYNNITFKLFDTEDIEQEFNYQINIDEGQNGYIYDIFLTSKGSITSGNYYYLTMLNNGTQIAQSEQFLISFQTEAPPSGTITNESGDITGAIDLNGIENRLDNVEQAIISGDNAILENQKENQSFWESTYNSLFSMDSGDVNEVYLMVQSYFPSGDTPLSVYDTIFGAYGNEPDDFIIRWDDHPLNITWFGGQQLYSGDFIHAGYMNFSKECRDNAVLGNIKFWLNTLLTIFIFIAYYKFLYKCYCDMLGVISEDIQEEPPEHRPIGFGRGDK